MWPQLGDVAIADADVRVAGAAAARADAGFRAPLYWLSASVLTMKSAPALRHASMPAWNAAASPLFRRRRTMWSTPWARATSDVPSRDPSSITSTSTTSMPGMLRGRSASVAGSVCASLRHGIWMISFNFNHSARPSTCWDDARLPDQLFDDAVPGDLRRTVVARVAERRRAPSIGARAVDRVRQGLGLRRADEPVDAVDDELVRSAGIGRGHDRLLRAGTPRASRSRNPRRRADRPPQAHRDTARAGARRRRRRGSRPGPRRPASAASRSIAARCVPSPATTSRIGRST